VVAPGSSQYTAYGNANAALTKTASGFDPRRNPYRYTGKRLDSGSGTYDMGARRYSASTGRFLQYDLFRRRAREPEPRRGPAHPEPVRARRRQPL
jgi:RHS repeat-associated protein